MEEKELKTSVGQRVAIILIAVTMLGSIVAGYAMVVANNGKGTSTNLDETAGIGNEKIAEYEANYKEKLAEFKKVSQGDFDKFIKYKSEIKAYNEAAANEGIVDTKDLYVGSGRELTDGDVDYLAYYVGWCADETVFDSTFDNPSNPTSFEKILDVKNISETSQGVIEGWSVGVIGMRLGGVREITISGNLAYGEEREICGGVNKPLKFMIMAVPNEGDLAAAANELDLADMKLLYAYYYGIDYDAEMVE